MITGKLLLTAITFTLASLTTFAQPKQSTAKKAIRQPATQKQLAQKETKATSSNQIIIAAAPAGNSRVKIVTDSGTIIVKLYDSTPLHRDNFLKLVNEKFYDSLLFHRVIQGFMIQGGDPTSKNATAGVQLGSGGGDMQRIPAEFRASIIHKRGALAAARDGNPERASSACQFYIVQGKISSDPELSSIEKNTGVKYSDDQKAIYKSIGGTPFLDQNYTVFGEVESGMEVVDKIAAVAKAPGDRPVGDVRMRMEVIK